MPHVADEFGADFIAETPDHPVDALLGADFVAGQQQDEIVGHIEALDMQPHAAVGNIGDQAIARQRVAAELDLCHPVDRAAPRPAALLHGRQAFGLQRVHAHDLLCCGRASSSATAHQAECVTGGNCSAAKRRAGICPAFS